MKTTIPRNFCAQDKLRQLFHALQIATKKCVCVFIKIKNKL